MGVDMAHEIFILLADGAHDEAQKCLLTREFTRRSVVNLCNP
jgi:uncharacterized protein YciU (UPF0263 family)